MVRNYENFLPLQNFFSSNLFTACRLLEKLLYFDGFFAKIVGGIHGVEIAEIYCHVTFFDKNFVKITLPMSCFDEIFLR